MIAVERGGGGMENIYAMILIHKKEEGGIGWVGLGILVDLGYARKRKD